MKINEIELKRLSRVELLEIIYELQKQHEETTIQMEQMQAELDTRKRHIRNSESIAEAAICINGVMEAAQAAADQYLVSVKAATVGLESQLDAVEKRRQTILQEAEEQAAETIRVAQREAKKIIAEAEDKAEEKLAYVEKQAKELLAVHDELRSLMCSR